MLEPWDPDIPPCYRFIENMVSWVEDQSLVAFFPCALNGIIRTTIK